MRKLMSRFIQKVYSMVLIRCEYLSDISILRKKRRKYLILFGSPLHGNLGDQAISCAERVYLINRFPNCGFLEVSRESFLISPTRYQEVIQRDDIILITGGGFLGDLWDNEDRFVKQVISLFRDNSLVVLPQSVYFDDPQKLLETQHFLEDYPNLYLFAREERSYHVFCKLYETARVYMVPDFVLTISGIETTDKPRHGALLCLRQDKEKTISDGLINALNNKLHEIDMPVHSVDTVEQCAISFRSRKRHVQRKLAMFSKAQLVVTDRLHGMLFAVITHTPCIAIDNLSQKVSGVYKWIRALPYLYMVDNEDEIEKAVDVCNAPRVLDAGFLLQDAFLPLQMVIEDCIRNE